ncbi:hypothetical protein LR48_Vigan11g141000 [Vigna angularis]|uniref:Uncharacterized protein n=1 Tax=Phaseolus angularis TaxID=3914 RepID=A0A0L9VTG3_PHAAN|nr:hypothetical protein LR48_Vigan11g141000 [Vigna angularis]
MRRRSTDRARPTRPGKATRLGVRGSIVPAAPRTSSSSFLKAGSQRIHGPCVVHSFLPPAKTKLDSEKKYNKKKQNKEKKKKGEG